MEILINHLVDFFINYGYFAVFIVLLFCGLGLPIPEDITLIAGGIICTLANESGYSPHLYTMMIVALSGVIVGDSIIFLLGRKLGPRVTHIPVLKLIITPKIYAQIQKKTKKYGQKILFVARFLPGLRAPIFLTAGVSHKVHFWQFLTLDGVAALVSVPLWVYAGFYFADDIDKALKWVKHSEYFIIITVAIFVSIFIFYQYKKHKRRKNAT